ncbi:MAG: AAA family ATPase [Deltaproteobacteria bacterium]|nr:AAA family ATPase [Deltaproteobacteria bacterium]
MTHLQLIKAMKRVEFYPNNPAEIELIETHISYVFIAGDVVYKIKKPVCFDFLDFTSLEKRKFYCEEELRLNRRLAPETYLDVVAISRNDRGNITLGEGVEVIDYAVRMKKLPADRMLKTMLFKGLADVKVMDDVAKKIADFHQNAQTGGHIDKMGDIENIRHNNEENFAETINYINITIPKYQYKFITNCTEKFLAENKNLFRRRVADHKIRDCHGDLHLEHICVDDEIIIFDCIEFNERFRCGDVAEDVAFLTMDIDFNGYSQYADAFIESYIKHSGDTDLPLLLNFYRCYYAYVRGKVTSFLLDQEELQESERRQITKNAAQYFDLAYTYATRLDKPVLILTAGLMGSGKSYQARALTARLGAEIIRTDILRKDSFNIKPTERRFEDFGQGIYSDDISRLIYDKAYDLAAQKIKQGKAVIIDASFKRRAERQKAMEMARKLGVRFYILECICSDEITKNRLEKRMREKDNASDGRWELFQEQKNDFDTINEVPADSHFIIDTSVEPETTRQKIIRKIKLED